MKSFTFHSVLLLATLFSGCRQPEFPIAPVSGTVTLDGQPLPQCRIGFEPLQAGHGINVGPGSYALTDANGHYELETLDGDRGAVVGPHLVWIRHFDPVAKDDTAEMPPASGDTIPERYNNPSILRYDVPTEGSNDADFQLTSKP